uniref:Ionotropic glutamate receptor C-terminal domain-containing protein n=2 Tax=Anopheles atroparvus TaxID=41427 RepID=A0A182IKJ8_ANOAO
MADLSPVVGDGRTPLATSATSIISRKQNKTWRTVPQRRQWIATAIILDREYLGVQYEKTLDETKNIVEKLIREHLKNGGMIVKYYSWTSINLKRDFSAVISVSGCKNTWDIYQEAVRERLVMLSITDPDCPRLPAGNAIMIPRSDGTANSFEEVSQIILDMKSSRSIDWRTATLLYDQAFDVEISRCILSLLEDREDMRALSLTEFKINAPTHSWEKRKEIRRTLLGIPTAYTGTNGSGCYDLKLVNPSSQWLYLLPHTDTYNDNFLASTTIINEGDNVAFVYNTGNKDRNCTVHILCYMESYLLHFIRSLSKLIREEQVVFGQISDEEWEIIRPSKLERKHKFLHMIKTAITAKDECNKCSQWKIQSAETWGYVYRTDFNSDPTDVQERKRFTILDIGYWTPQDGFMLTDALFPHARFGFRGTQFIFYSYHNPPWQFVTYNESGSPVISGGVVHDILTELARKLNFTYTMVISQPTEQNGSLIEGNATASLDPGILFILFAAIGATVSEKQKKFISYTYPISIQTYSFIISRPRELSRVLLFLSPFGPDTWLCLAAAVALMGPILFLINKLSPYYEVHNKPNNVGLGKMNNCFWYIYGALLQQVVLVIVTTYCGNLVAFLTFPKIDIPVNRIMQLLRNDRGMTWSIRRGTFLEEVLMESNEPKYVQLYKGSQVISELTEELVDRIEAGQHVHIDWRNNLRYLMKRQFLQTDRCDFALSTDEFLDEQIALVMPKDSPYLELVNDEIKRMHQFGFIQRWVTQYLPAKDKCSGAGRVMDVQNHTVNSSDMAGSYWILLLGFSCGLFIFAGEFAYSQYRKYRRSKVAVVSYRDAPAWTLLVTPSPLMLSAWGWLYRCRCLPVVVQRLPEILPRLVLAGTAHVLALADLQSVVVGQELAVRVQHRQRVLVVDENVTLEVPVALPRDRLLASDPRRLRLTVLVADGRAAVERLALPVWAEPVRRRALHMPVVQYEVGFGGGGAGAAAARRARRAKAGVELRPPVVPAGTVVENDRRNVGEFGLRRRQTGILRECLMLWLIVRLMLLLLVVMEVLLLLLLLLKLLVKLLLLLVLLLVLLLLVLLLHRNVVMSVRRLLAVGMPAEGRRVWSTLAGGDVVALRELLHTAGRLPVHVRWRRLVWAGREGRLGVRTAIVLVSSATGRSHLLREQRAVDGVVAEREREVRERRRRRLVVLERHVADGRRVCLRGAARLSQLVRLLVQLQRLADGLHLAVELLDRAVAVRRGQEVGVGMSRGRHLTATAATLTNHRRHGQMGWEALGGADGLTGLAAAASGGILCSFVDGVSRGVGVACVPAPFDGPAVGFTRCRLPLVTATVELVVVVMVAVVEVAPPFAGPPYTSSTGTNVFSTAF